MMMKMELKNSLELIDQQGNVNTQKKQEEEEEEEEIIKKQGGEGGKHELLHVLAVDDSLIDRKLLEKLLTVSSYQVTCVESGDKALEYLGLLHNNNNSNAEIISDSTTSSCASCTCTASSSSSSSSSQTSKQELQGSKVNLIMTDYSMPGMSGYDLLKIVKGSSWKDVPVVVMSSENEPSRINMCLEGGAKEFLLKPVKLSDLRKLQSQLLISHSEYPSDDEEKIKIPTNLVDEINKNNESTITNNSNNKRKAMSPDISQLRPELVKDIVVS
ncbi:hypothetical protein LguiA_018209 [Lonicera macranthoides]